MVSQPVSSSFSSEGTLQANSTSASFEGEVLQVLKDEAKQACGFAKSVLVRVQLPSPAKDHEEVNNTIPRSLSSIHQPANGACLTTPKKSTTTANFFHTYKLPPTPEDTPTKSAKRSHTIAFHDSTGTPTATTHVKTTNCTTKTPVINPTKRQHATGTSIPPTPTRRTLFHNTPKWSIASQGSKTTTPIVLQTTHLPTPPPPVSPRPSTPPPPHLQTLQEELAQPLPSDIIPTPTTLSPYTFRTTHPQSITPPIVIDADESGTYDPTVKEEWTTASEEEEEESTDEEETADEKPHCATIMKRRRRSANAAGATTRLSLIEYERFWESLRRQVCFAVVDRDVASNRGKRVFRRVLEEMFCERMGEV